MAHCEVEHFTIDGDPEPALLDELLNRDMAVDRVPHLDGFLRD